MVNGKIVLLKLMLVFFLTFATNVAGGFGGTSLDFFKKQSKRNWLFSNEYENQIYLGKLNSSSSLIYNIGNDVSFATITRSSGKVFVLGFPLSSRFYSFLKSNRYFVDNLLLTSGFWLQLDMNSLLTFRFYPLLHYSAYTTDGTEKDIFNNRFKFQILLTPQKIAGLEILAAGSYCYKSEVRKYFRGSGNINLFYSIPLKFKITPVLFLSNQLVYERGVKYGIDGGVGFEIKSPKLQGVGFFLNIFDKISEGQNYQKKEEGIGFNLRIDL